MLHCDLPPHLIPHLTNAYVKQQAAFAKWNEGQKDRPKQVNAALEAHKARVSAASAAGEQQKETITIKPVLKGRKEQPLELHPDSFVRIKAQKIADAAEHPLPVAIGSLVESKATQVVDVEVGHALK